LGGKRVKRVFSTVVRDQAEAIELMRRLEGLECEMEAKVRGRHLTLTIKGSKERVRRAGEEVRGLLRRGWEE